MQRGALRAADLGRRFRINPEGRRTLKEAIVRRRQSRGRDIWAVRHVDFTAAPGESIGVVGRNGSGKTTLLRLIAEIFSPTEGTIEVGGSVGSLLGLGAGFHQDFTGRENVLLNGALHGLPRQYVRERMDEIVAFAEIEDFIDVPVRTYSAGMYTRLGFAVATHLRADVLLLDEVFAVGDESFQRKCFGKIFEFKQRGGTILFVSHAAAAVENLCERALLLRGGNLEYDGATREAITRYRAMLAEEDDPEERNAGLQEWGSGEARVTRVRLEDDAGKERKQYLAGEPLVALLDLEVDRPVSGLRVVFEVHQVGSGVIASSSHDLESLGLDAVGTGVIRFETGALPLADGQFEVAVSLVDAGGGHAYHRWLAAAAFTVYPADERAPGLVRLDGRWSPAGDASAVSA